MANKGVLINWTASKSSRAKKLSCGCNIFNPLTSIRTHEPHAPPHAAAKTCQKLRNWRCTGRHYWHDILYSLQSPSTGHSSDSLFCCSTMYSGNGSFYRIRIVQSFVKTISEQSLVRGGVARLPQGEIFLRKNQTLTLNLSLLNMTDHFRTSENSANIMILQPIHLFTPGMLPSAKLRSLRDF